MTLTKKILFVTILFLVIKYSDAQKLLDPDKILKPAGSNLPHIFLAGTFHFEYYNLDAYKVDKSKQVDILSPRKQTELKELLNYISLFKPSKICIEAPAKWNAMNKYRDYKAGKKPLGKNEIDQIAFRLMDRFSLDTLYSVDAASIADDLTANKDSTIIKPYIDSIFNDYHFKANENYNKWGDYKTSLQTKLPLLEYFKYQNSQKVLQKDYGAYLLGDFKLREYRGADALATYWYDRNLRIFRNIQKITTSPDDRILVLFGSGHISVLDQLLTCSPEYNYIKFNDLKKTSK